MSSNSPLRLPEAGESSKFGESDQVGESVHAHMAGENSQPNDTDVDADFEIDSFFASSPAGQVDFNPFSSNFTDEDLLRTPSGSTIPDPNSVLGESGRFYHGYKQEDSGYLLPNDAVEQDRLDLQHTLWKVLFNGKLTLAPLPEAPRLVLDVATGTGIWAIEFARANPSSFVIGTDLSKIQPNLDVPNCLFERLDTEDDWLWTHKFDYIHIRALATAFKNPERLFEQAFAALNPGGWLELQDFSFEVLADEGEDRLSTSYASRLIQLGLEGMARHGIDGLKPHHYKEWLTEIGFAEVQQEDIRRVPIGPWSNNPKEKRAGQYWQVDMLSGLRGTSFGMLRGAGLQPQEIDDLVTNVETEIKRGDIRTYLPCWVVYGRKPLLNEEAMPQDVIPEDSTTQGFAAQTETPTEMKPEEPIPQDFMPEDFLPQELLPEELMHQDFILQDVIPEEDLHKESTRTIASFFARSPTGQDFNPFVSNFIDEEILRAPTGSTVADSNSVIGESGRSYHGYKQGTYLLPNDAAEQDRLDLQHKMLIVMFGGKLGFAPFSEAPRLVLDVATGTGVWALEFARANPSSFVIGTDLSKIQPDTAVPNCLFERDDCEDEWLWTHKFDYIHMRFLAGAIKDPKRLIKQAYDNLKPGGWLEMQDGCIQVLPDEEGDEKVAKSAIKRYCDQLVVGMAKHGIDGVKAQYYKDWITETGFSEVRIKEFKGPYHALSTNPREKLVSKYWRADLLSGLRGVGFLALRSAGMEVDEVESLVAEAKNDLKRGDIRGYAPFCVVYGQKPFVAEGPTTKQSWPGMGPALELDEGYEADEGFY